MKQKLKRLLALAQVARKTRTEARRSRWLLGKEVARLTEATKSKPAMMTIAAIAKATTTSRAQARTQEKFLSEAKSFFFRYTTVEKAINGTVAKKKKKASKKTKPRKTQQAKKALVVCLDLTKAEFAYVVEGYNKL
ncbi:MAG: hypothetical protein FJ187_10095 [Gammaproteobacteria bacterium]|nr:hypothetical protein [Gammaproteobacteria bacterium]